ncbi:MAG: GNAT family N-acetyltransferase [Caulobacteraceae bacterium]
MERLAEVLIVPAGPGDAADVARLHVEAWRETYAGILPGPYLRAMNPRTHARRWRLQLTAAKPGDVVLLAEGPGGLIGYCAGAVEGPEAEIYTLYLLKSAQRSGVGRRLLGAAARVLALRGAASLELEVLSENRPARGFYEHLGGKNAGERPVRGWGGGLMETIYHWHDITTLFGG